MILRRHVPLLTAASLLLTPILPGCQRDPTPPPGNPVQVQAVTYQGLQDVVVLENLNNPTSLRFAADGRVFVAEKGGRIVTFDSLNDTTPTVVADLSTAVHNFWDRGLLGMALDPGYPARPYLYVLYTFDSAIGGTPPRWGDSCSDPPGATTNGCAVSGRLSRLQLTEHVMTGPETVLIEDWPQQFPSHSVGSLEFGADGALYVTAGDGASFNFVDYGQTGEPLNPFGEPPGAVGTPLTPPTAAGGALRSQSPRRTGPVALNGSVLRIDPDTGAARVGNPMFGNADANLARVLAYGLRNPFRMTIRPGTNEVWSGDVGWNEWEEINVVAPTASLVNFGWPCYEGAARHGGYDSTNLDLCESLYAAGTAAAPFYAYKHSDQVAPNDGCGSGSSSVSGLAFYGQGAYPEALHQALFFSDYSRRCIWAMRVGANGLPDPASITPIVSEANNPVELRVGPNGDVFYVDLGGKIHQLRYLVPTALGLASPAEGPTPLTVTFDGTASTPGRAGETLTYAWDLDADGAFDDATGATASYTYNTAGTYNARLRVTDTNGVSADSQPIVVRAGITNRAPTVVIDTPALSFLWNVGQTVQFTGHANDPEDGALAASSLRWDFRMLHCPGGVCHVHPIQSFVGVASGQLTAPDHEYPSSIELVLTATDSNGTAASTTVRLEPQTVTLTLATNIPGLRLSLGAEEGVAPLTATAIVGSAQTISAPSPQVIGGTSHSFVSWSDGQAASHNIVAPAAATTYTASFTQTGGDGTGLQGEYFSDMTLGTSALTRTDAQVNFDWGGDAPAAGVANDRFSARWTGRVRAPITGPVTFHVTSDDGQRLWIGGQLLINDWIDHGPTERTATIDMVANQLYDLKYEFYENGGGAVARLGWSGPGLGLAPIPAGNLFLPTAAEGTGLRGEYFDDQTLTQSTLVRVDSEVDFDWGQGSPAAAIGGDTFSARWTGQVQAPVSGPITFHTVSDDGIRLFINDVAVIDQWNLHSPTEHTGVFTMSAGQRYSIRLEFFEQSGGATARLLWSGSGLARAVVPKARLFPDTVTPPTTDGTGVGLRGEYFSGIAFATSVLVRTDATVNFDWGGGPPASTVNGDLFSVRWTGQVEARNTETLTFHTISDDGIRLRVGGQTIIDNWTLHGPTEDVGSLSVVAGQKYPVVLEYFEQTGGAVSRLQWSSASFAKQEIPTTRLYLP